MSKWVELSKTEELLKKRLYETALNNAGQRALVDDICEDIANNRVGQWLAEVPSIEDDVIAYCLRNNMVVVDRETFEWMKHDSEKVTRHAYIRRSRVFNGLDECSNCGCAYPHNREKGVYLNYCAKCGAKFDGEVWD